MRLITLILSGFLFTGPLMADDYQDGAYDCLDGVETTADWNQCLGVTFAPCSDYDVGSDAHLGCLVKLREDWRFEMITTQTEAMNALSEEASAELAGLMQAWPKFVEDKCEEVALERAHISAGAARLGCHVSEMFLMSFEFRSCLKGQSNEHYCEALKE